MSRRPDQKLILSLIGNKSVTVTDNEELKRFCPSHQFIDGSYYGLSFTDGKVRIHKVRDYVPDQNNFGVKE